MCQASKLDASLWSSDTWCDLEKRSRFFKFHYITHGPYFLNRKSHISLARSLEQPYITSIKMTLCKFHQMVVIFHFYPDKTAPQISFSKFKRKCVFYYPCLRFIDRIWWPYQFYCEAWGIFLVPHVSQGELCPLSWLLCSLIPPDKFLKANVQTSMIFSTSQI